MQLKFFDFMLCSLLLKESSGNNRPRNIAWFVELSAAKYALWENCPWKMWPNFDTYPGAGERNGIENQEREHEKGLGHEMKNIFEGP